MLLHRSPARSVLVLPAPLLRADPSDFTRCPTGIKPMELKCLNGMHLDADTLLRFGYWVTEHISDDELLPWYRFLLRRACGCSSALARQVRCSQVAELVAVMWYEGWLRPRGPRSKDGKTAHPEELDLWLRRQHEAWASNHIAVEERRALREQPSSAPVALGTPDDKSLGATARRSSRGGVSAPRQTARLQLNWMEDDSASRQLGEIGARRRATRAAAKQRDYATIKEEMQEQLRYVHKGVRRDEGEAQTDLSITTENWLSSDILRGFVTKLVRNPDLVFSDGMMRMAIQGRKSSHISFRVLVHTLSAAMWLWDKHRRRHQLPGIYKGRQTGSKWRQVPEHVGLQARMTKLEWEAVQIHQRYRSMLDKIQVSHAVRLKDLTVIHRQAMAQQEREVQQVIDTERLQRDRAERLCRDQLRLTDMHSRELAISEHAIQQRTRELELVLDAALHGMKDQSRKHQLLDLAAKVEQSNALCRVCGTLDELCEAILSKHQTANHIAASAGWRTERLVGALEHREAALQECVRDLEDSVQQLAADRDQLLAAGAVVSGPAKGITIAQLAHGSNAVRIRIGGRPRDPTPGLGSCSSGTWDIRDLSSPVWMPETTASDEMRTERAAAEAALGFASQWRCYANGGSAGRHTRLPFPAPQPPARRPMRLTGPVLPPTIPTRRPQSARR
eukprot:TRINITY_DN11132_c0_g1_i1.p1 TRINITY_DN11132_c0_g1~~TRINITY_DN11132_c0_g1_i1.p1  ORF type:complete len:704 (+),score=162.92 TRINITY_DN11132_c0_g1_i1:85-2112(+)